MKYLVCGGRDFSDIYREFDDPALKNQRHEEYDFVIFKLNEIICDDPFPIIISGGARGVDRTAIDFAKASSCEYKEVPAQWDIYGKSAGYRRNEEMIKLNPDIVISFPGGAGTNMMKNIAMKNGVKVIEYIKD